MQKKIIALAIAGLSTAAFAQSNVTISGQMKVGFDSVGASGATAGSGVDLTTRARMVDQNSTLRFAGSEDLGGGMKAIFQIESAVGSTDNIGTTGAQGGGANATTIGARDTWVGLSGGWGTIKAGKLSIHYGTGGGVDPNGIGNVHQLSSSYLSLLHTNNGANGAGGRWNNTLLYTLPNMSGFDMDIAYTTTAGAAGIGNESTVTGAQKEMGINFNPRYTNGPIQLFYSYLRRADIANVVNGPQADQVMNRAGGAYTTSVGIKFGAIWDRNSAKAAGGVETRRTAYLIPVSYTTGSHSIGGTYGRAGNSNISNAGGDQANTGAAFYHLGYGYAMSKRTTLGVAFQRIKNDRAATYDFWHPSDNVGAGAAIPAGADPSKFGVSIQHTF